MDSVTVKNIGERGSSASGEGCDYECMHAEASGGKTNT